jgi:hypothetical protein
MRRATLGIFFILLAGCSDRTLDPLAPRSSGPRLDAGLVTESVVNGIAVSSDVFAAPVLVGGATFGPALTSTADFSLEGVVVRGVDVPNAAGPTQFDACTPFLNASEVAGKIALVDRGTCTFVVKVLNAQAAGAIGVIIRDNVREPIFKMAGDEPAITIPAVFISLFDGTVMRDQLLRAPLTARIFVEPVAAPTVSVPSDIVVETTDPTGAAVTYSATGTRSGATIAADCAPWASGRRFPLGATPVECRITDAWGNTVSAAFTVTVRPPDTEAPVLHVAPIAAELTGLGTIVNYSVAATDNVGVVGSPVCTPPSGSAFPLGVTTVSCTATDAAGNIGSATFTVTILDTTAPTLTMPSTVVTDATSPSGAAVSYTVSASDLSGDATVHCAPVAGSVFVVGTTRVSCTATDASGNVATGSFDVAVKGAASQVADLQLAVASLNLQDGTETSVQAKLAAAQNALASGNLSSACGSFNALINQVSAQSGKKIPVSDAQALITTVRRMQAAAGC